jgi:hypothetical protein
MNDHQVSIHLFQPGTRHHRSATPAEHTALVLTALGPAFLHQLAFGPGLDAPTFTQGLRALIRG